MNRIAKVLLILSMIAMVISAITTSVFSWGPASRQTFTMDTPPEHVAFNSIIDNPIWGDERIFMEIKEAGQPDSEYVTLMELQPGKTYTIRAYYHNNSEIVAQGAYARVYAPSVVHGSEYATFYFGAENAEHFNSNGNNLGNEVCPVPKFLPRNAIP